MSQVLAAAFFVVISAALILWLVGERGKLLLPSTSRFMKELRLRHFFDLTALHGYLYGRWPGRYIKILRERVLPRLGVRGKKWLAERYHSKVLTNDHAKAVVSVNRKIPLQEIEQVIPYPMARKIVIDGPPDIIAFDCPCRQLRPDHCKPLQVCLSVGQPFVDFIAEHHPDRSRRLSQAEALDLLEAEHRRGRVHTAWFKDAMLDRFYMICNCCSCCCAGIEAMKRHHIPVILSSGYVSVINSDDCSVCGTCADSCPFDALSVGPESVRMDWEKCMGCGVCAAMCPNGARALERDESKGIPLDVALLA